MITYLQLYFRMSRPAQLLLIGVVYAYGAALANAQGFSWDWVELTAGGFVLLLVSISARYVNEYADYDSDRLTQRTPFSGGSGALVESNIPKQYALYGAWSAISIGLLLAVGFTGIGLLSRASLLILAAGAFLGWMYSLKPMAFARRGWGELVNSFLGGLLLPLYGYSVLSDFVDGFPVVVSLPFFALAFVNLLATTWPDREADAIVGKLTLATRWPPQSLRFLYWVVAIAAVTIMILQAGRVVPVPIIFTSLAVLPLVIWGGLTYTKNCNPFPSVAAMVSLVVLQLAGWLFLV